MPRSCWRQLARDAEQLAAETVRAEEYLIRSPALWRLIGVPWRLRRALLRGGRKSVTPAAVRVMRFDFHFTTEGWRVSEVNSDVPGGYCEASSFTQLIAEHFPDFRVAGDPGELWASAMVARATGPMALLSAPGFMEDQQVVAYLAKQLRKRGCHAILTEPAQLRWRDGYAYFGEVRLSAIVRFYQVEWLANLPRRCEWWNLLAGGRTPVSNAGAALLTESKRFPLAWAALPFDLPTWQRLLPEPRDPRDAPWERDDGWLIKSAYCNTGDTVMIRELAEVQRWRKAARAARWHPKKWVAQRRFETVPLASPIGAVYPCVGVYVIDGVAAGAYARISRGPVVDYRAIDIALLLSEEADDE